ncbi:hypothetical protein HPB51_012306 [Rhipicephalus microplus]|uniref:Exonuclease domain-containing protein n=1 Tax=Rhipicephalus microplus TaxID=6941 RepID=A0A9J6EP93_RHIMP|nr:hypothetical protein HPB51_012306 [Rhipicephalus microplus]
MQVQRPDRRGHGGREDEPNGCPGCPAGPFSADTILLGHILDLDLRALRLIHETVVDTAAVFPHRWRLPYKRALRTLITSAPQHLSKIIQNGVDGHDSQEDAAACVELMLWKVLDDLKKGAR